MEERKIIHCKACLFFSSDTSSSCLLPGCNAVLTLESGSVQTDVDSGVMIHHFKCNQDYVMVGKDRISCRGGVWNGSRPRCYKGQWIRYRPRPYDHHHHHHHHSHHCHLNHHHRHHLNHLSFTGLFMINNIQNCKVQTQTTVVSSHCHQLSCWTFTTGNRFTTG